MRLLPQLRLVPFDALVIRGRVPWRPYRVAFVVVMLGLAVPFVTRTKSEWDTVFVPAAARLLAGADLYDLPHGYTYPPFQAAFAVPVVGLSKTVSRLAWYAANVAALAWLLRSAWRLAGGGTDRREQIACCLGLAAGLPFLFNALSHQQTDIVLAALAVGGCERLARGKPFAAATLIGLAAAMKCTPLLFAPYLVVRRQPLAAGWLVAVAVGANLLPDVIRRPADGHTAWLTKWYAQYLAPMARPDYAPGVWASEVVYNQSAVGAANRWTHTTWTTDGRGVAVTAVSPAVSPTELKRCLLGAAAACGLIGLGAMAMGRRGGAADAVPWECGMVFAGMLLFSPMSGPAHFGLLLLPGFLLGRAVMVERRLGLVPFLAAVLLGAAMANKDLVGGRLYTVGLWYGSGTLAAAAAFLGCAAGLTGGVTGITSTRWKPGPARRPRFVAAAGRSTPPGGPASRDC